MPKIQFILLTFISLLFSACTSPTSSPTPAGVIVTPTPFALAVTPDKTPSATPSPTPIPLQRPQYTLNLLIDYTRKAAVVEETILYPNLSGESLPNLVLAVGPNLWTGGFSLKELTVDGVPVRTYRLEGQRLEIPLPQPLEPGSITKLSLTYSLILPQIPAYSDPNNVRPQIYGYTSRQVNLVEWYPFIVPYIPGTGWVLHNPWFYGEHLVYAAADYEVNLKFADPASAPVVAASGAPEPALKGSTGDSTRYILTSGRAFVFSMSREFKVASQQVGDVTVSSYYFQFNENGGQAALNASAQALQVFSQRYGPYSHKNLSIVMGDFDDGMEYSAFFFLPRSAYNLYDGTNANLLTTVSVHETAHQWWFEQVANDQALQPWLDEALATHSEIVFYQSVYPQLLSWWWSYWPGRLQGNYPAQGWVDISVYDGGGFSTYAATVYLNGAHFLEDLRARIGDDAFFSFIQDYLSQENGRIATAADFFALLSQHTSVDYSDIIGKYFKDSQ